MARCDTMVGSTTTLFYNEGIDWKAANNNVCVNYNNKNIDVNNKKAKDNNENLTTQTFWYIICISKNGVMRCTLR